MEKVEALKTAQALVEVASGTPKDIEPHAHPTMGVDDSTHSIFGLRGYY